MELEDTIRELKWQLGEADVALAVGETDSARVWLESMLALLADKLHVDYVVRRERPCQAKVSHASIVSWYSWLYERTSKLEELIRKLWPILDEDGTRESLRSAKQMLDDEFLAE